VRRDLALARGVRRGLAFAAALLLATAAAGAEPGPEEDYVLHCSGCHRLDGSGAPGVAPGLGDIGELLAASGGRDYLVRVPGVAQAPLDDVRLARLLNFVLRELAGSTAEPPYDAREVGRLRRSPLRDPRADRARLSLPRP
jgi:cytochrome c peroxidase